MLEGAQLDFQRTVIIKYFLKFHELPFGCKTPSRMVIVVASAPVKSCILLPGIAHNGQSVPRGGICPCPFHYDKFCERKGKVVERLSEIFFWDSSCNSSCFCPLHCCSALWTPLDVLIYNSVVFNKQMLHCGRNCTSDHSFRVITSALLLCYCFYQHLLCKYMETYQTKTMCYATGSVFLRNRDVTILQGG